MLHVEPSSIVTVLPLSMVTGPKVPPFVPATTVRSSLIFVLLKKIALTGA